MWAGFLTLCNFCWVRFLVFFWVNCKRLWGDVHLNVTRQPSSRPESLRTARRENSSPPRDRRDQPEPSWGSRLPWQQCFPCLSWRVGEDQVGAIKRNTLCTRMFAKRWRTLFRAEDHLETGGVSTAWSMKAAGRTFNSHSNGFTGFHKENELSSD